MKKTHGQKVDIEFHTSVRCISFLLALMNAHQSLHIPMHWGSWTSTSVFKTMNKNFESSGNIIVVLCPQMYHSESLTLHYHSANKQHWALLKIFLYICYGCEKNYSYEFFESFSICLRRQIASVHLYHDTDASPKKTRILCSLVLIMSTGSLKLSLAAFYLFFGLF